MLCRKNKWKQCKKEKQTHAVTIADEEGGRDEEKEAMPARSDKKDAINSELVLQFEVVKVDKHLAQKSSVGKKNCSQKKPKNKKMHARK